MKPFDPFVKLQPAGKRTDAVLSSVVTVFSVVAESAVEEA
jgi:hypothetical protein